MLLPELIVCVVCISLAGSLKQPKKQFLTADGLTEKEIADRLFVSIQTVKTHRKNILKKTGTKNSPELVKWAMAYMYL